MADDARTALIQRSERGRSLASRGVVLMASNMLSVLVGFLGVMLLSGTAQLVVAVVMLLYAAVSTVVGLACLFRGLQLDRRAGLDLYRLDHGELPAARLLR